ncbi:Paraquat-inducible protein B [Klebsiella pneumoniae subsp. ozaenae]|uniref:Paraquat-inducible protein B n=1 Tax=Klebsiella pneumoniae subsp. ozaenae TaxID=574 RepID=A0A377ZFJ1_KLEPO|nr:Paraquat-inducible protein B [Klebsiella pneumoniae subsp. ozaenae]
MVEAPEAGSLGIGTPVLFRGLEVGTVTGLSLGSMSDRVMVKLRISKRYQYLVRNNSVFWLASGYRLDFGLIGGVVKTGTFNQFIRGGSPLPRRRHAAGAEGPGWQALPATGERAERVAGVGHRSAAVMPPSPAPGNAGRGRG